LIIRAASSIVRQLRLEKHIHYRTERGSGCVKTISHRWRINCSMRDGKKRVEK